MYFTPFTNSAHICSSPPLLTIFISVLPPAGPSYHRVDLDPPYPKNYSLSDGPTPSDKDHFTHPPPPLTYDQAPPPPQSQHQPVVNPGEKQYPAPTQPRHYPQIPDFDSYQAAGVNGYSGGQYPQSTRPRDGSEPNERTSLLNS